VPCDNRSGTGRDCSSRPSGPQRVRALLPDGQADAVRGLLEAGIEVPIFGGGDAGGALARGVRRPALAYHYDFRMRPDLNR
jgi:hypothetical protein